MGTSTSQTIANVAMLVTALGLVLMAELIADRTSFSVMAGAALGLGWWRCWDMGRPS